MKCSLELLWSRVGDECSWWSGRSPRADKTGHSLAQGVRGSAASQGRDAGVAVEVLWWGGSPHAECCSGINLANTVDLQGVQLLWGFPMAFWDVMKPGALVCMEVKVRNFVPCQCGQHHHYVSHCSISHHGYLQGSHWPLTSCTCLLQGSTVYYCSAV